MSTGAEARMLEVRFPELPVPVYLRTMAWGNSTGAAILSDPALEAVARANGVRILDRSVQQLGHTTAAAFHSAAATAVRAGASTMAPVVSAPIRLWAEGLTNAERFSEWLERLGGSTADLPAMTREIEATWGKLFAVAKESYAATN